MTNEAAPCSTSAAHDTLCHHYMVEAPLAINCAAIQKSASSGATITFTQELW